MWQHINRQGLGVFMGVHIQWGVFGLLHRAELAKIANFEDTCSHFTETSEILIIKKTLNNEIHISYTGEDC